MAAAEHNFYIEQGSDFDIIFQYLDENSIPVNLKNGYSAVLAYQPINSSLSTRYSSNGNSLTLSSNGEIKWSIKSAQTNLMTWSSAVYDLYISNISTSKQLRLSTGTITIIKPNLPLEDIIYSDSTPSYFTNTDNVNNPPPTPSESGTNIGGASDTEDDLCQLICNNLDLYATVYNGSKMIIPDNSQISDTIVVSSSGKLTGLDVFIDGLKHQNPQDLSMILTPPSGSGILLSSHNKINNYTSYTGGINFIFSNKAANGIYLNNISNNNQYINILDKRANYPSGAYLQSGFNHLIGYQSSGNWTLKILDDDISGTGLISGWGIILHNEPPQTSTSWLSEWE